MTPVEIALGLGACAMAAKALGILPSKPSQVGYLSAPSSVGYAPQRSASGSPGGITRTIVTNVLRSHRQHCPRS